jgi:LmbE family N-acetylglucosaminyl deacetylase
MKSMRSLPVFALGLCAGLMLAAALGLSQPTPQAEVPQAAAPQAQNTAAALQSATTAKGTLSWEWAATPAPPPEDGKLRIIQFGAHPDDCEIRAGGCGAMWARLGHHVKFVSVTNGDIGHWQMAGGPLALRRTAEAFKAAKILGVATEVLPIHDGELEPTLENRRTITRLIRAWNADIVISHRPNDYHPDHRYVGVLVQDSAYMVAVPFFCPEVPPLKKNPVFLFSYDTFQRPNPFRPDIVVAIDEVIEQKLDALVAMPSQFIEGGALGNASMVPTNAEQMEKRVREVRDSFRRRFASIADRCRPKLIELYGEEAGNKVRYAEAFEICEYGRQPRPEEIRELFPFLPKK